MDDVVVAAGHTVTFGAGQYATLAPGRLIAVLAGGTLRIQGALDVYNSLVIVLGTLVVEGADYLYVLVCGVTDETRGGVLRIAAVIHAGADPDEPARR